MGYWSHLKDAILGVGVSRVLTWTEAKELKAGWGYKHHAQWTCKCGANLHITCKAEREARQGSNARIKRDGHATLQPDKLNWNGLAEERGWKIDPTRCPACLRGMTVIQYKDARRSGRIS